jgi:hypothetical protein
VTDQLEGVDVVVGDHTDEQVSTVQPNGTLLVENRSKGVMFTRVRLVVDSESGELLYRTADYHRPWNIGVTPDPEMAATLEQLTIDLAPTLGRVIGSAVQPIPRADACGMETGRTCESLIGDVVADALRTTYGTDFAITNSGGIRADLTCPPDGGEFCPTDSGQISITEGQVLTVLPFGNVAVTVEISGAELKAKLEAGVAAMPAASGAFPQISGFCFTYDIDAEPGNRVTGAVRQAVDGTCGGEAIDLSEAASYTIATNDFTASGGDNYPPILSRAATRDILASVVSSYAAGESPLSLPGEPLDPKIEGLDRLCRGGMSGACGRLADNGCLSGSETVCQGTAGRNGQRTTMVGGLVGDGLGRERRWIPIARGGRCSEEVPPQIVPQPLRRRPEFLLKGSPECLLDGGRFGCCSHDHDRDAAFIRHNVRAGDGSRDQEIPQKGEPADEDEQIAQATGQ